MSRKQSYVAPNGNKTNCIKSCHYNNEIVLMSESNAYDQFDNIYPVGNGINFLKFDRYSIFIGKQKEEGKDPVTALFGYLNTEGSKKNGIILNDLNEIPSDIISGYFQDKENMYLFSKSMKVYKSLGKEDGGDGLFFYPIAFTYEKERTTKKADVNKITLTICVLIDLLNGEGAESWLRVNNRDATFVYIRFVIPEEKAKWFAIGDDDRRDTTFRDMAAAFDVG
jgi:hypothetical protein